MNNQETKIYQKTNQNKEEKLMEKRKQDILSNLTALKNVYYEKQEGLQEMLTLQNEMEKEMFGETQFGHKGFYNIINEVRDYRFHDKRIRNEVVNRFINNCYTMVSKIKCEKSGLQGEKIANYSLDNIKEEHVVLRNLELDDNGKKTEIDFIVITRYGIFILEIKNTRNNVIIDDKGNYYSISRNNNKIYDKNIGIKCNNRKSLLEKVIKQSKFSNALEHKEIQQIVVFTNTQINVKNDYKYIKECFLPILPHMIDEFKGEEILSRRDLSNLLIYLKAKESPSGYLPVELDVEQFKNDFADIIVTMEKEKCEYPNYNNKESIGYKINSFFKRNFFGTYRKKSVA